MNLEEIEAKADELLTSVLSEDHASRAEHSARKLRCLELTARIKATVASRKERETERARDDALRMREIAAMETAAGAASRAALTQQFARQGEVYSAAVGALAEELQPTKPVADRLHELVSYCREREEYKGRDNEIGADTAYGDVADKLQEILQEGGI